MARKEQKWEDPEGNHNQKDPEITKLYMKNAELKTGSHICRYCKGITQFKEENSVPEK
jgi:hypothetical protein